MKPLVCFDVEATGTNTASDRIVQIALQEVGGSTELDLLINPGCPIPPESTEIHKISDEIVANLPGFAHHAEAIRNIVTGADLLGFNLANFDVPILWEEFYRCGIEWDLSDTRILDAGTLFKRREERTLSAAVQFYCNREHDEAHDAGGDVAATVDVWLAQLERYGLHSSDREALERESNYEEKRVDLAGKIIVGKDGRPTYNIGKVRGTAVEDDPGFGYWMLDRDFSENTKIALRRILFAESSPVESSGDGLF